MSDKKGGRMDRRGFLGAATFSSAMAMMGFSVADASQTKTEPVQTDLSADNQIGPVTKLKRWRDRYHADLFDDFLPFCEKHVIDHQYGGFMCETGPDGVNVDTDKVTWFQA